jgi:dTDP-4-dehydrorhamnose 3,5-epimerase
MAPTGSPDKQTVDSSGQQIVVNLEGVAVSAPQAHEDHRGVLVEMFSPPSFWKDPFTCAYQTSIRPGFYKGWFVHRKKCDRYHLVVGELLLFLFDDRKSSPSGGMTQKLVLSERNHRDILIPPGVRHLLLNLGRSDAVLVNFPTTHYNSESPDREYLPVESPDIPVDVRAYFPPTGLREVPPAPRGD